MIHDGDGDGDGGECNYILYYTYFHPLHDPKVILNHNLLCLQGFNCALCFRVSKGTQQFDNQQKEEGRSKRETITVTETETEVRQS